MSLKRGRHISAARTGADAIAAAQLAIDQVERPCPAAPTARYPRPCGQARVCVKLKTEKDNPRVHANRMGNLNQHHQHHRLDLPQ